MSEDVSLQQINILLQSKRYADAEKYLRDLLAESPNQVHYLALLAEVYLRQDKTAAARQTIESALGLAPDNSYLLEVRARVAIDEENFKEAEHFLQQAVALSPDEADHFAWLAHIKLIRKQYAEALKLANQALTLDAENLLALNTRSSALLKLDQKEASFQTIEGALREDPNNSYTHANYGWNLLEKGDHKKALNHFKEALQNDPTNHMAQAGMLEAIKASNPLYRVYLAYSFWIGNLTERYQWGVIIGFYLGMRGLRILADQYAGLRPYLVPLIVLLGVIAFSTWVIGPIGDLFLRFNKYGQLLLEKHKRTASNFVAASFAVFLLGLLAYVALGDARMLPIAAFGFAMMLPLSVMFSPSKNQLFLRIYVFAMAFLGLASIAQTLLTGELIGLFGTLFILGFVGFQWIANFLSIREDNR